MRAKAIWLLSLSILVAPVIHGGEPAQFALSQQEKTLLDLTNRERKKQEQKPLAANALLFKAARAHAENMAKQGKTEHVLDGKDQYDRMEAAGYKYAKGGENLAFMDPDDKLTLDDLMQAWMESKAHRVNILTADFAETGLGVAKGKNGRIYFAQLFGKPLK